MKVHVWRKWQRFKLCSQPSGKVGIHPNLFVLVQVWCKHISLFWEKKKQKQELFTVQASSLNRLALFQWKHLYSYARFIQSIKRKKSISRNVLCQQSPDFKAVRAAELRKWRTANNKMWAVKSCRLEGLFHRLFTQLWSVWMSVWLYTMCIHYPISGLTCALFLRGSTTQPCGTTAYWFWVQTGGSFRGKALVTSWWRASLSEPVWAWLSTLCPAWQ